MVGCSAELKGKLVTPATIPTGNTHFTAPFGGVTIIALYYLNTHTPEWQHLHMRGHKDLNGTGAVGHSNASRRT